MVKIKKYNSDDVSSWVSYVLPMISLFIVLLAPLLPFNIYDNWYLSESGFIKVGTFVFLILEWERLASFIAPRQLSSHLQAIYLVYL